MAKKNQFLDIRLVGPIGEAPARFSWAARERASAYDLERALWRAVADDRIHGLRLSVHGANLGWSKAESLHRAIRAMRERGKTTIAFLSAADNVSYLMACACETVLLAPSALLPLHALSSEKMFFKDLLGAIGVQPQLEAVGEYKSAGEPFDRRESSDAHRSETLALLEDLSAQFVRQIASARGLSDGEVVDAIASGPFLPEDAVASRLVDRVAHEDACQAQLEQTLGENVRAVPLARYARTPRLWTRVWRWRRPRVAVVHTTGVITSGESGQGSPRAAAGARGLTELIAKLRDHPRVRAIVVRIDSPGGGALASDTIHRELELAAAAKPVVVSMGDVAASGGYYIATAARAVVAEGMTLTGSIGVIGGKLVVKQLLDRLGISRESLSLGTNAGMFSATRAFTDSEQAWYRRYLEHFYRSRFLAVVAEGRSLSVEQADAAGRGRVWTGRQAKGVGLVDQLGGLHDAIGVACEQAGLDRQRARVIAYGRRARLRELVPGAFRGGLLLDDTATWWSSVEELAREELLLLMPPVFRAR